MLMVNSFFVLVKSLVTIFGNWLGADMMGRCTHQLKIRFFLARYQSLVVIIDLLIRWIVVLRPTLGGEWFEFKTMISFCVMIWHVNYGKSNLLQCLGCNIGWKPWLFHRRCDRFLHGQKLEPQRAENRWKNGLKAGVRDKDVIQIIQITG